MPADSISSSEFSAIAGMLYEMSGIDLPASKSAMVAARLSKRIRDLRLSGFSAYCAFLESPENADERQEMLFALTTNMTSFDRERRQLDHFAETVLPGLVAAARAGRRVRIWSAACSSGEEAYSLAFRVRAACPEAATLDLKILATDIDRKVLATARRGIYPDSALAKLPDTYRDSYFHPADASHDKREVVPEVKALVAFRPLNLLGPWPFKGGFDMIMCRNVAIYFDPPTQNRLWKKLAETLAPDGVLYIGHSESIQILGELDFVQIGHSTFRPRCKHPGETRSSPALIPENQL